MIAGSERKAYGVNVLLISVMVIVFVGCTYISNIKIKESIILQQKALIGRMYEMDASVCEKMLGQMFAETNDTDIENGEAVLLKLGYTRDGMEYLFVQSGLQDIQTMLFVVQIFMAAGLLVLLVGCVHTYAVSMQKTMTLEKEIISKAAEKEIRLSKDMAQNLVENIAHQIKTPLACISISLDMLLETLQENAQKERIGEAFLHLKKIEVLMKRLLDIGRLEAGKVLMKKETVSLEMVIESCIKYLGTEGERITFTVEGETQQAFYGDAHWLYEAFCNIIKNSVEHDRSGSDISIKLHYRKELVFVQIRDHGVGISEADLGNIFDRFYIPDNAKSSHTGIGLNLAKLVVEKHFGTIEAVNHEDGGVLVSICFPIYGLKNDKM